MLPLLAFYIRATIQKKKKKILEEFLQRDYSIQFQKLLSDSIRISIKSTLLLHELRTRWNNSRKGKGVRKRRTTRKKETRETEWNERKREGGVLFSSADGMRQRRRRRRERRAFVFPSARGNFVGRSGRGGEGRERFGGKE